MCRVTEMLMVVSRGLKGIETTGPTALKHTLGQCRTLWQVYGTVKHSHCTCDCQNCSLINDVKKMGKYMYKAII